MLRPPRRSHRARGAYTLVEVALAVAVGTVLMLVILELLRKSSAIFAQSNEKLDSLQSATMISEIIHRDLRYMVIPLHKPPADAAPEIVAATNPDPTDPTAPTPAPSTAPTPSPFDAGGSKELLLPFSSDFGERQDAKPFWHPERARPDASGAIRFDLTGAGNDKDPTTEFSFYRTKMDDGSGGLFGSGGTKASYNLLRITYKALGSSRYEDPRLYILQRTTQPLRLVISEDGDARLEDDGTEEVRKYTMFYFRRLILSLHEAPEAGLLGGTPGATSSGPGGAIPTVVSAIADAISGANPSASPEETPFDALYFARIMIAGASAGPGARVLAKGPEDRSAKKQSLDLLVNLIHLDGVTDRFRGRSLARNWNYELPPTEPP